MEGGGGWDWKQKCTAIINNVQKVKEIKRVSSIFFSPEHFLARHLGASSKMKGYKPSTGCPVWENWPAVHEKPDYWSCNPGSRSSQ